MLRIKQKYPDTKDPDSELSLKIEEIHKELVESNDPVVKSKKYPEYLASLASEELGVSQQKNNRFQQSSSNETPQKRFVPAVGSSFTSSRKTNGDIFAQLEDLPLHERHQAIQAVLKASALSDQANR